MKKGFIRRTLGLFLAASIVIAQVPQAAEAYEGTTQYGEELSVEDSSEVMISEDFASDESSEEASDYEDSDATEIDVISEDVSGNETVEDDTDSYEELVSEDDLVSEEADDVADAELMATSGELGSNIIWSLDASGTLTLTGSGVMEDMMPTTRPWEDYLKSIKKVVVKDSITTIGKYAFWECSNLKEVSLESNITSIGEEAFFMTAVESINFPSSLREIGSNAFEYAHLTSVILPASVTEVGDWAFAYNTRLTKVVVETKKMTVSGMFAFQECPISSVTLPKDMTVIPAYLLHDAKFGDIKITIPKTVKTIGRSAFSASSKSSGTMEVVFEDGSQLSTIGDSAFSQARLFKITLPESLKEIDDQAFHYTRISEIVIPSKVNNIGSWAFADNKFLAKVTLNSNTLTDCEVFAFDGCGISQVVFGDNVTAIPDYLFYSADFSGCTVTIPKRIKTIGKGAFYSDGKGSIDALKFEAGSECKSIGSEAFANCRLYELRLPDKLKEIGYQTFRGTYIEDLVIPSGVTKIDAWAFGDCPLLSKVTIPASVKEIGYQAFTTTGSKDIMVIVPKGCYAYDWIKKNANDNNYIITESFPISYVLNGGTNSDKNPVNYLKGESISLSDPTRTGYTFGGWFLDSKFTKAAPSVDTSKGGKLTFYAKWTAKTYTVSVNANGGKLSGAPTFQVTYGKAYPKFTNTASRNGYNFAGWYTLPEGGSKIKPGSTVFKPENPDSAKIYAHWTPVKYKITYRLGGGTQKKAPATYTADKDCVLAVPTKTGYTFAGWKVEQSAGKMALSGGIIKAGSGNYGNVTLTATWNENVYDLIVHKNNSSDSKDITNTRRVRYTEEFEMYSVAGSFEGYHPENGGKFTSFVVSVNSRADGKGKKYSMASNYSGLSTGSDPNGKEIAQVHLYAQWGKEIFYRIGYVLDGGTLKTPVNAYDGSADVKIPNPTRTGYKFTGWDAKYINSQMKLSTKGNVTTIKKGSAGDIYFVAKFTPITYNVKLSTNGGVYLDKNNKKQTTMLFASGVAYGEDVTKKADFSDFCSKRLSRKGYTFAGFATDKAGKNLVINASGRSVGQYTSGIKNLTTKDKATVTLYAIWTK